VISLCNNAKRDTRRAAGSTTPSRPIAQQKRFEAYLDRLAETAGHLDRSLPLKNYCKGLLLPGERKSVEPMAARLAPENVRRMHQSLHHLVADAPWSDEEMLQRVREYALAAMQKREPVVGWIVDDTGFPKKGQESVGVARQYCGQLGKQDNCRVAVSLSVSTRTLSVPVAYRLYLPESWVSDIARRKKTGVPEEIQFQTKPQIALDQIRRAVEQDVPRGVVLADAAYGMDSKFRAGLRELQMEYGVGVQRIRHAGLRRRNAESECDATRSTEHGTQRGQCNRRQNDAARRLQDQSDQKETDRRGIRVDEDGGNAAQDKASGCASRGMGFYLYGRCL
jgi:SRSO17 transposase